MADFLDSEAEESEVCCKEFHFVQNYRDLRIHPLPRYANQVRKSEALLTNDLGMWIFND